MVDIWLVDCPNQLTYIWILSINIQRKNTQWGNLLIHGRHMTSIWSIYVQYMVDIWQMTGIWQAYGRYMAGIWSIDIWQTERVGKSKEEGSNKEDNPHVQLKCHQMWMLASCTLNFQSQNVTAVKVRKSVFHLIESFALRASENKQSEIRKSIIIEIASCTPAIF